MIELYWSAYLCTVHLTACYYHVTYAFQSESTLYIFQNVKELLAGNRSDIWSDCNGTEPHNHLVRKRRLNHLVKLTKRLSRVVSTYLYGEFDCILLSCHVLISEWIHTLYWMSRNVKELSGCGFESHCSHLNFTYRACFEQGVPWRSGKYRVWIRSEMGTWHDNNIQSTIIVSSFPQES